MSDTQPPGFVATDSQSRNDRVEILKRTEGGVESLDDLVSVEEPLEIRIAGGGFDEMTLAITMRTPGHDDELTLGFLFSEGIIGSIDDVISLEHCRPPSPDKGFHNSICATLAPGVAFKPEQLERHFYTSSSCGVCGKTSIESVMDKSLAKIANKLRISQDALENLPEALGQYQNEFKRTGGIHAAGLVDGSGKLTEVREDIGRHNALDKLIGAALVKRHIPLAGHGLLLSGRAGFELVQKAAMAGAELVASIGPPSSLSVELAVGSGQTLAGFVSRSGFNLYSHPERII